MRFTIILVLFFPLLFFVGCAEKNPFGTIYVEGFVTLDGTPIQGINVTLMPRGDGAHAAGGLTDNAGKFTVTTGGAPMGSGAKPGEYDITFRKVEMAGSDLPMEELARLSRGGMPPTTYIVPQKYEDPKTSGIAPITVSTNRADNKFTFALTSD
jgi:hypothetical protein